MKAPLAINRTDGYSWTITNTDEKLVVVVTRQSDKKSWTGTRDHIRDAVNLASKIVEDQKLIAQLHEGDANASTKSVPEISTETEKPTESDGSASSLFGYET